MSNLSNVTSDLILAAKTRSFFDKGPFQYKPVCKQNAIGKCSFLLQTSKNVNVSEFTQKEVLVNSEIMLCFDAN